MGAPLSNSADCFSVDEDGQWKHGWEEDCEGWEQDECHNDVHIAHAGEHASGDAVSESHLVAQGEVVIPEQHIVTSLEVAEYNTSHAASNKTKAVHSAEAFSVNGEIVNQKFEAFQACTTETDDFVGEGSAACDFNQQEMSNNFEDPCECRALHGRHAQYHNDNELECEDSCVHSESVGDEDADLDHRIADSVEKAISDILSDVINRCISTSLHDCIQI
jgi:hypothetical protein